MPLTTTSAVNLLLILLSMSLHLLDGSRTDKGSNGTPWTRGKYFHSVQELFMLLLRPKASSDRR
ncbi:hypothetical protein PsorP6_008134 [Peronosclerospora sorghi]|uniref:Uncharacterized protein n=1 Tax=Peronosclerospora sorghi TaxID=230839 RepID=A0ACC0W8R6_9STRA|nr:hypothetical protein PsorP6_008134 [Peronosclerospora sorghi]